MPTDAECSFCGKVTSKVKQLIALLPAVAILSVATAATAQTEGWRLIEQVDRLDGSKTKLLYTIAFEIDGQPPRALLGAIDVMQLGIFCSDGRPLLAIKTSGLRLPRFGEAIVSYRLDERPPIRERKWTRYDGSQANLQGSAAARFIDEMRGASRLLIRLHEDSRSSDGTFNVAGLQEALEPLRKDCKV